MLLAGRPAYDISGDPVGTVSVIQPTIRPRAAKPRTKRLHTDARLYTRGGRHSDATRLTRSNRASE